MITNAVEGSFCVNFELTEDEEMLKALVERFVIDHYRQESRSTGFSATNWSTLAELGLIAALFPEDAGGLGVAPTGIATIFEALGRGLTREPLIENIMVAGRLFAAHAPAALRDEWLEGLMTGTRRIALAHQEAGSHGDNGEIETHAAFSEGMHRLSGAKPYCFAGDGADGFVVSARIENAPGQKGSAELFFVRRDACGLVCQPWRLADGIMAASLTLENTPGVLVPGGLAALHDTDVLASLARSAEMLGIMERLFADTLDYLRTRQQFGQPLGTFQAIQHRMVEQHLVVEQGRALLNLAMVSHESEAFVRHVHGVRAYLAEAALPFGHEMIQFHGGIGITDELALAGGHKRLLVLSRWPEPALATLDRYRVMAA